MNHQIKNTRHHTTLRRGFTLVEMIVVIVIIGFLTAVIAPRLLGRVFEAKRTKARADLAHLKTAVNLFSLDCRPVRPGDTLQDLLWDQPSDISEESWQGPYIEKVADLTDPWASSYVLVVPGELNVDFDVLSYGADGQLGGEDDDEDIVK